MAEPITDWLQTAVTELRAHLPADSWPYPSSMEGIKRALADHVETALKQYKLDKADFDSESDYHGHGLHTAEVMLGSLAQLVATVTGIPAPEGAQ